MARIWSEDGIANRPKNLKVEVAPDYEVLLLYPDSTSNYLCVRGRYSWKFLTAICHGRTFARKHPDIEVFVQLLE